MNLIIHDLTQAECKKLGLIFGEDEKVIDNTSRIHDCTGCFGCWLKTPGRCVVEDDCQRIGELLSKAERLVIISKCTFGGYSSFVKGVLERTISYLLPFLKVSEDRMRHESRYVHSFSVKVIFYGEDISMAERETAVELVYANARAYCAKVEGVYFIKDTEEIKEVLK